MPPYKKTDKRQNNIIFLTILKDIYQQILDSDYKLLVWEQVLEECRSYGFNEDTTAEYLRRTRWPSIIRATRIKWEAKEKELDEKDIYIIGIERMRKPDFCFPMNEEEAMQNPDDPMADVAESQSYTQDDEFFDATDDYVDALDDQIADVVVESCNDEPTTNLQNEFYRAGIRAMDECASYYAQLKLNMMSQNLDNSRNNICYLFCCSKKKL